jgi:hemin uptake protein HemP
MPPTSPPKTGQLVDSDRSDPGRPVPIVDSAELLGGRRELIIRHGAGTYRLRITASNKLILTK